jgi:hypothetical protein
MAQPPVYVQNAQGQYVPAQQQPPQYVQQAPQVRRAPDQRIVLPRRAALRRAHTASCCALLRRHPRRTLRSYLHARCALMRAAIRIARFAPLCMRAAH